MNRRVAITILPFLIFTGVFASFRSLGAQDNSSLEQERSVLQSELADLENQISQYEGELHKRQDEISTLNNQIAVINAQIGKINAEIQKTETQISTTRLDIQETEEEIDKASADIEKSKAILAELLRDMYALSNESLVEQLLRYNSLSDALGKVKYASAVQERMNIALAETREIRQILEGHRRALGENEVQLENKNRQLAVQKDAEANQKAHKDSLLAETREEEAVYQQLLSSAEQERAEFLERLAQIEEQIKVSENFLTYFKAGEIPPPGTKIFIWPQENATLTQSYGHTAFARRGAYGGQGHNGIDMSAGLASPIRAAAGGTVVAVGDQSCVDYVNRSCNGFWGNWVAIEHAAGLVTLYSHMTKKSHRAVGEKVETGDVIGYEGATGNITGPHLHFTVYTEFFTFKDPATGETRFSYNFGKTINPLDYL